MSVPVQTTFTEATGNGVTTTFPFGFLIKSAADLVVTIDGATPSVSYTVTGIGLAGGGNVVFSLPPGSGAKILMRRLIALQRTTDYQYQGEVPSATLNSDFDRVWMALQQVSFNVFGALRAPFPEQIPSIPPAAERAGRLLSFDSQGNPIAALPQPSDSALALRNDLIASDGLGLIGSFPSYDALRAYLGNSKRVYVTGVLGTASASNIAGEFFLDASDSTSPDNGGTIIVDVLGRRWKRSLVGSAILSSWFGVLADGVADDTTAFWAAHRAAGGMEVLHPVGIVRITSPKPADIKPIRLSGRGGDAYVTHQIINQPQLNNDPLYRVTGTGTPGSSVPVSAAAENAYMLSVCPGLTIIKCDGCNLIGAPDVGTAMNGAPDPLRCVQDIVIWCVNGRSMASTRTRQ